MGGARDDPNARQRLERLDHVLHDDLSAASEDDEDVLGCGVTMPCSGEVRRDHDLAHGERRATEIAGLGDDGSVDAVVVDVSGGRAAANGPVEPVPGTSRISRNFWRSSP